MFQLPRVVPLVWTVFISGRLRRSLHHFYRLRSDGDTYRRNHRLLLHAPNFAPHRKVPGQIDMPHTLQYAYMLSKESFRPMSAEGALARHGARGASRSRDATTAPLLHVSTGRGYDRYPSVDWTLVKTAWPGPISRVPVSPKFPADGGHFS